MSTQVIREPTGPACNLSFIEHEDGSPITDSEATQIRGTARSVFAQFMKDGTAPAKWGQISVLSQDFFFNVISERFPYIAMCEDMWKAQLLATLCYPSWHRNNREKIEKEKQEKQWIQLQLEHGRQVKEETLEHVERVEEKLKRPHTASNAAGAGQTRPIKKAKVNDIPAAVLSNASSQQGPSAHFPPTARSPAYRQGVANSVATIRSNAPSKQATPPPAQLITTARALEHGQDVTSSVESSQHEYLQTSSPTPTICSRSRSPEHLQYVENSVTSPPESVNAQQSPQSYSMPSLEDSLALGGSLDIVGATNDGMNVTGMTLDDVNIGVFDSPGVRRLEAEDSLPCGVSFSREPATPEFNVSPGDISARQDLQSSNTSSVSDLAMSRRPSSDSTEGTEYRAPVAQFNELAQSQLGYEFEDAPVQLVTSSPAIYSSLSTGDEEEPEESLTISHSPVLNERHLSHETQLFSATGLGNIFLSPQVTLPAHNDLDEPVPTPQQETTAEALLALRDAEPHKRMRPTPRDPDSSSTPLDADTLFDRAAPKPVRNPL